MVGVGEEALHPQFEELLEYLFDRATRNRLSITTNGSLITSKVVGSLVARFDQVYVSLCASRSSTYRQLVPGLRFEEVLENVKNLRVARQLARRERPHMCAVFVAMRSNIIELPEFVDLCVDAGFDTIAVQHLTITRPEMREESLSLHKELSNTKMGDALRRIKASRLGIAAFPGPFPVEDGRSRRSQPQEKAKCALPWRSARIESPGKVVPCCFFAGHAMGDIRDSTFAEVWNSRCFRDLRRSVNGPSCPKPCSRCLPRRPGETPDCFYDTTLVA